MRKYIVAIAALAVAALLPSAPAHGAGLYRLDGWVIDARGTGIANVDVSGGSQPATSDSMGAFRIEESSPGTYRLRFTSSRIDTFTEDVPINSLLFPDSREFTARYRLTNVIASPMISTRNGPRTVTASLSSQAPDPGTPGQAGRSCVKVTDSRTGTTGDATRVVGSETAWTYSVDIPASSNEGTYSLKAKAVDCASGLVLSSPSGTNGWYTVDNTPPQIPPSSVFPTDGGNTEYGGAMWAAARISDPGGVVPGSIRFELRDASGNLVFQTTGAGGTHPVSYNSATGWAKASTGGLQEGQLYTLTVSAADRAGNTALVRPDELSSGGGILVTRTTPQASMASIPSTSCTVSATVDPTSGMREAVCSNVRAHLAATTVGLQGLRHVDSGYVSQFFPLDKLLMTTRVGGVTLSLPPPDRNEPTLVPRTRSMRYDVDRSTSSATSVVVPAVDRNIGTIRLKVPATWDNASVEMPDTPTLASVATCADSSGPTTWLPCTPDPLNARFVVTLKATADVAAAQARHTSELDVVVRQVVGRMYAAYVPPESLAALETDPDVEKVARETSASEAAPDDWIGTADTSALAPAVRQAFGTRYGGDWIDRSVMPSVWRIGVKASTAADQQVLDAITGANARVVVQSVAYSMADFDGFVAAATDVLEAHAVSLRSLVRDYERGRLIVRAEALDDAVQADLAAALPTGVPYAELGVMDDRFLHATRHLSGIEPSEGGLNLDIFNPDGSPRSGESCTSAFTAYLTDGFGTRTNYGVTAGHCLHVAGLKVGQGAQVMGSRVWSGFAAGGTTTSDTAYYSALDGSFDGSGRIMVGLEAHRDIRGKFADSGITRGLKTCFQGAVSGRDRSFDNCGTIQREREDTKVKYPLHDTRIQRDWCFDDASVSGGDSGGPVYEPHYPTVKLMGVASSANNKVGNLRPIPAAAGTSTTQQDLGEAGEVMICFTSVGQFEATTGLTVQEG